MEFNSVAESAALTLPAGLGGSACSPVALDVPKLLADWARRRPAAIAVMADHRTWTYAQLAADVARHSDRLVSAGVGPEVAVGVLAHRCYALVVGFLATLRAGGVYVPMHPDLPESRHRALIEATNPKVMLTEEALCAWAHQICPAKCAVLDIVPERRAADCPLEPMPDRQRAPDSAAYVIQTSGSTGEPKSIQAQTGAMSNLVEWYADVCDMNSQSRVAQISSANFDASLKNYLAPFVCGAALVLFPDIPYDPGQLLNFISDNQITILNCIPSMFYALLEAARPGGFQQLSCVRVLAFGTETPDLGPLRPWMQSEFFEARILNMYGPTECTILSSYASIG
jgi:iturin family lipopeptide synthetase A